MQLGVIVNNKYAPLKHFVYVLTFPTLLCLLLLLLLSWAQRPHVRASVRAYGSLFLSGAAFCFPITCRHKSAHPTMTNLQNSVLRRCIFKAGTYFCLASRSPPFVASVFPCVRAEEGTATAMIWTWRKAVKPAFKVEQRFIVLYNKHRNAVFRTGGGEIMILLLSPPPFEIRKWQLVGQTHNLKHHTVISQMHWFYSTYPSV